MFRGMSQQDAHEFLGWVLNKVAEDVEVVDRSMRSAGIEAPPSKGLGKTFVQNLFSTDVFSRRAVPGLVDRYRAAYIGHRMSPPVLGERDAVPEEQVLLRLVLWSPGGGETVRTLFHRWCLTLIAL